MACHGEPSLEMERAGRPVSLFVDGGRFAASAHGDMDCTGCHEGFRADEIPHAPRITRVRCQACHQGGDLDRYPKSVHGRPGPGGTESASCADCHSTHAVTRLSDLEPSLRKEFASGACRRCHGEIAALLARSDHGLALGRGVWGAPTCVDCHGAHAVLHVADSASPTSRHAEARMCLGCHLDNPDVRSRVGPSAGFIDSYEQSVHGQAVQKGNESAAVCSDCHGSHEVRKASRSDSRVAKQRIAATCGACHSDVRDAYEGSVHGKALEAGIEASASCTDCHGEHGILSPQDPRSPVAARNVSARVCTPCHESAKLTAKYGLAADRFRSFADSYHGLAGRAGSVEVANCASCHGVHDIKPSGDSTSRIHPRNLAATCGSCHPGANENFTKGAVHVIPGAGDDGILSFVASSYVVLIVVLVGGMFLHNALDFIRKSRRRLSERRGLSHRPHPGHRLYLRMSLNERLQHGALLVSFLTLVVTGFALRYPDAWWVAPVRSLSPFVFELRGIVHRVAGVALVLVSLYHVFYLFFDPRGKQLLRDLLPVPADLREALGMLKYNIGLARERPRLGRFSYIEKSEYWALVWGTVVMAVTGVILWFDNTFLGLLTKLWWDVARSVHYYEAWLATLAIVVWHFYFVMFNPDTYPLNLAFWKGTLSEEEMEEEHPRELEEIRRRENARAPEEAEEDSPA
ncbi:MAG: cytochrome b/b6 domain-containing protein [Bacteroidota bacterium]